MILRSGNENLELKFDDDGEELHPGDRVLVNDETVAMIAEIDGDLTLVGWPNDEIVHCIESVIALCAVVNYPESRLGSNSSTEGLKRQNSRARFRRKLRQMSIFLRPRTV